MWRVADSLSRVRGHVYQVLESMKTIWIDSWVRQNIFHCYLEHAGGEDGGGDHGHHEEEEGVSAHQPPQPPEHLLEGGVQQTVPPEHPQRVQRSLHPVLLTITSQSQMGWKYFSLNQVFFSLIQIYFLWFKYFPSGYKYSLPSKYIKLLVCLRYYFTWWIKIIFL